MSLSDRILGVLGGGMVVAALALFVTGGEGDAGPADAPPLADAPALALVSPRDGARVDGDVEVVFRVGGAVQRLPGGWGVGDHHLHLELDGIELMPADGDLEKVDEGVYRWTLARVSPGAHALRLLWSGPDHRPLEATATPRVRVEVR